MALGAVLAAALTDASVRIAGLYLSGTDVIKGPAGGNRYGVPIESIEVTEQGPGGISTMTFTIDDPIIEVETLPSAEVRFEIFARGTMFRGWVDTFMRVPAFGDQGRVIEVSAVGVESYLDWTVASVSFAVPAGIRVDAAVQLIVSFMTGVGVPINDANLPTGTASPSTRDYPVGNTGPDVTTDPMTVASGTTLRAALQALQAVSPSPQEATVDFYLGLRAWDMYGYPNRAAPAEYAPIQVIDTGASVQPAEDLNHVITTAAYRSVMVVGTGVNVTVTDGSGAVGPMARLEDSSITTASAARAAGIAFLRRNVTTVRGTFHRSDWPMTGGTSYPNLRAASRLTVTDARASLASEQYPVTEVRHTYQGGGTLETLEITYGGLPPSAVMVIRHLTRGTVN